LPAGRGPIRCRERAPARGEAEAVDAEPWRHFYESDFQAFWALVLLPALFLVYAATRGRALAERSALPEARFAFAWSLVFAIETIADPLASGPLARALSLSDAAKQAVMLVFVLLGDFRVWLLAVALAMGRARLARAALASAGLTLVVPIAAFATDAALRARWPSLPGQVLWLVYELGFLAFALRVRAALLPRLAGAASRLRVPRALLAYAAVYYALWALADVLILAGVDAGWLLRVIPNQLYYAVFVPFAFWLCLRPEPRRRDASPVEG
jgi:hypothetical protein